MNEYGKLIVATLEEIQNALVQVDSMQCDRLIQRILEAAHIYISGKGRSGLQMQALLRLIFSYFLSTLQPIVKVKKLQHSILMV